MPKKKPYPLTDLTGGMNVNKDPIYLADKDSPNVRCVRYDKGIVKKDWGWAEFGLPLLGTPMLIDTYYKSDGVYRVLCFTTTSAYLWDTTLLEWVDITLGETISDCESAWTAAAATVTSTADATDYKRDSKSSKNVISDAFTTGLASYTDFSAVDLSDYTHLHAFIKSSIDLAAGDAQLLLDNTSACASPLETLSLPALVAGVWTRVSIALADPSADTAIASLGLSMATDVGAVTIWLDDVRAVLESTGTNKDAYSATTFMDTYVVTNYKDAIKKYDASSDSLALLGGSPPKAKSITTFMNRLVVCFTNESAVDHPFRIKWSDPGTIETWDASNYLEASDNAEWCVHLVTLGGKCALFKESSLWDLTYIGGTVVFQLQPKINQIGTMAPATVARMRENLVFFAYDGIYVYDQTQAQCISDNLYPLLFRTGDKTVNLGAVQCFNAAFVEELREYWISLCENSSTTPSLLLKYNLETNSFVRRDSKPITCIGYYERVSAQETWATVAGTFATADSSWGRRSLPGNAATTLLGYYTGQIYEDDRFTPTSDELIFETKDFMYGHATRIMECRVAARYGGYSLYYSLDGGATWVLGRTFAYAGDWVEHLCELNLTTQRIRFKISSTESFLEIRWIEPWHIDRVRSKTLTVS